MHTMGYYLTRLSLGLAFLALGLESLLDFARIAPAFFIGIPCFLAIDFSTDLNDMLPRLADLTRTDSDRSDRFSSILSVSFKQFDHLYMVT